MRNTEIYKVFLSNWKPEYGKKPNNKQLTLAEHVAKRGSKTAFALAMGMRPEGTSQSQIVKVLGLPHRNKIRKLAAEKRLKVTTTGKRPQCLHLELTE